MSYIYSANDFRNENHDVRIYCHSDLGVSRLQVIWNLHSKEIAESSAKHGVRDAIELVPALKLGALEAHQAAGSQWTVPLVVVAVGVLKL
jgi:hypothetical protein